MSRRRRSTLAVITLALVAACADGAGSAGPSTGPSSSGAGGGSTSTTAAQGPSALPMLSIPGLRTAVVTDQLAVPRRVVRLDRTRRLVQDQVGTIRVLQGDVLRAQPFLDVRASTLGPSSSSLELGLAGFQPAPDFATWTTISLPITTGGKLWDLTTDGEHLYLMLATPGGPAGTMLRIERA